MGGIQRNIFGNGGKVCNADSSRQERWPRWKRFASALTICAAGALALLPACSRAENVPSTGPQEIQQNEPENAESHHTSGKLPVPIVGATLEERGSRGSLPVILVQAPPLVERRKGVSCSEATRELIGRHHKRREGSEEGQIELKTYPNPFSKIGDATLWCGDSVRVQEASIAALDDAIVFVERNGETAVATLGLSTPSCTVSVAGRVIAEVAFQHCDGEICLKVRPVESF